MFDQLDQTPPEVVIMLLSLAAALAFVAVIVKMVHAENARLARKQETDIRTLAARVRMYQENNPDARPRRYLEFVSPVLPELQESELERGRR
jgi:hypothetical protein